SRFSDSRRDSSTNPCERPCRHGTRSGRSRARGAARRRAWCPSAATPRPPCFRCPSAALPRSAIGQPLEASRQASPYGRLADEALAAWIRATRHVQRAVVREESHYPVQIMGIECVQEGLGHFHGGQLLIGHDVAPGFLADVIPKVATISPSRRWTRLTGAPS